MEKIWRGLWRSEVRAAMSITEPGGTGGGGHIGLTLSVRSSVPHSMSSL